MDTSLQLQEPVYSLNRTFLIDYPIDAARKLETMPLEDAASILAGQQAGAIARVIGRMSPGSVAPLLRKLPVQLATDVLATVDTGISVMVLSAMDAQERETYFNLMDKRNVPEFRILLDYPENSVGRFMSPTVTACNKDITVEDALKILRQQNIGNIKHLFLLNNDMQLDSVVDIYKLVVSDGGEKLSALSKPVITFVNAMDPREEVTEKLEQYKVPVMPVVDIDHKLVGVIRGQDLLEAMREDIVTDIQTMVGASKDERALSTSFFAVRKRQPWLQINLLTAFLAAAVVGMFEDTIARFTALAVLLPIAAGQSGNTGAQSLAVTMRGLTLREITMSHWFRVTMKELSAGFINGLGIALTCSLGVWFWSRNLGLVLVMAMAMIISMTLAGIAGAVIPILLKRMGLDPAQSSSIVLTTVTDIAGFMSFLGIATLMSGMLAGT